MSTEIPVSTPLSHTSTDEYWDINGVALNQYGWNVETIGGSRYDLPTKRGENRVYPYRPGARHKKDKMPEQRQIQLHMWVTATHPGTGQLDGEMKTRWNDSWNFIRELVWSWSGVQLTLTRRWWQTITYADGSRERVLLKAHSLVEVTDSMPPTMTGRFRATFQMTLIMASPFFYGDTIAETIGVGETKQIFNPGQDRAMYENNSVLFTGPLWRPRLINVTPTPDVWLKYDSKISSGMGVGFNIPEFLTVDTSGNNVIRYKVNSGSRFWFGLVPGANLVSFEETGSDRPSTLGHGGFATITYKPSYL